MSSWCGPPVRLPLPPPRTRWRDYDTFSRRIVARCPGAALASGHDRLGTALAGHLAGGDATYGAGGPEVTVSPYELFRALFSRRSLAQMRAWGAPALTDEQLGAICVFGPREDDQPVPV